MNSLNISQVKNSANEDAERFPNIVYYPKQEKNLESSNLFPAEEAGVFRVRHKQSEAEEAVPENKRVAYAII